jgi:hypothetical protein
MAKTFKDPIAPPQSTYGPPAPFAKQPKYDDRNKFFPAGDYYGTGFKSKVGKMRGSPSNTNIPQKAMRKAPESLA